MPAVSRGRALTRAQLRVLLCLLATILLFVSRPAAAMVLAPMCGGHGETLTAPPITRNATEVPLAPGGCDRKEDARVDRHAPNPTPPSAPVVELVPRLPPVRYALPPAPRVLTPIESAASGERAGHCRGIERPPRCSVRSAGRSTRF